MSKIRINELARELEVKPNVILDLLPELGVHDKKTHSSSLDDDVALAVRRRLGGSGSVAIAEMEREEAKPEAPAPVTQAAPPVPEVREQPVPAPVAETP